MSVHEQEQMHINITLGNISRRISGKRLPLDKRERLLLGDAYDDFYNDLSNESQSKIRNCFNRKDLSFYGQARQASETFFHTYFDENGQKRARLPELRSHISDFWKKQLSSSQTDYPEMMCFFLDDTALSSSRGKTVKETRAFLERLRRR